MIQNLRSLPMTRTVLHQYRLGIIMMMITPIVPIMLPHIHLVDYGLSLFSQASIMLWLMVLEARQATMRSQLVLLVPGQIMTTLVIRSELYGLMK